MHILHIGYIPCLGYSQQLLAKLITLKTSNSQETLKMRAILRSPLCETRSTRKFAALCQCELFHRHDQWSPITLDEPKKCHTVTSTAKFGSAILHTTS